MKKIVFILLVVLSVSCSTSVDRTIVDPNSNNLKSFVEPVLDFGITKTELYSRLGQPFDTGSSYTTLGITALYRSGNESIIEISYDLNFTLVNQTEIVLTDVKVTFKPSTTNYKFILNFLNEKYGQPTFSSGIITDRYDWSTSLYNVTLFFKSDINNNVDPLFMKYKAN